MSIRHKMYVNLALFITIAFYLGYREMLMMHPDAIGILNLKM